MNDNSDKLIKTIIKKREVIYYLTTEEDLQNVKSNSLLGDISVLLASLAAGGIISVILTRATGIQLGQEIINVLDILLYVFVILTIIFACFTAYFYYRSFITITRIKGSGAVKSLKSVAQEETAEPTKTEKEITQRVPGLKIIKAEYWTQKERLDVTNELREMIVDNKLKTIISNNIKGDPDPGTKKRLSIEYEFNNITVTKEYTEGDKVVIP
ncbi:hypothetical protein ACFLXQ_06160 [Chloroflexota bacterium]